MSRDSYNRVMIIKDEKPSVSQQNARDIRDKRMWELKQKEPTLSYTVIGSRFGVSPSTVQSALKRYEKQMKQKSA